MFIHFLLAMLPIIWLIIALSGLKMAGHVACPIALIITVIEALFLWKQKIIDVLTGGLEGFAMAIWPICLVIVAAVFTYNLVVHTKNMELIKKMLTSVSKDKRILVLIISWGFGGFMEGMAGFGTAIAIPASMLVALGFEPLFSCLVCLIANGVPTPFGSIGIPTVTLANLVGLENTQLAFTQTLQLAPFMLLCPFLIVMATGKGVKAFKGVTVVTLVSGLSFLIPQMIVAKFVGAELCVVVGSVCSLLCTILLGSKVKPNPEYEMKLEAAEKITVKKAFTAWSPFIFIFIFLLSTSKLVAPVNTYLSQFASTATIYTGENPSTMTFTWINTPGVWIFLSAILGGLIQKATFRDFKVVFIATIKQMSQTIITMLCVLGCAKIMGYAGMIASIASFAIAVTGSFYPFFAPWIGCLGTFVTGSGTSSGVLFGAVQESAAQSLNVNPYWIVALNSLGVAAGKMLSPQSIAIALSSVDGQGQDSKLLSKILPYGVAFIIAMSFVAYFGQKFF